MRDGRCGLRGITRFALMPVGVSPNSVMGVTPTTTAPLARKRAAAVASSWRGAGSPMSVPRVHGNPRKTNSSLTAVGTPSSGPMGCPARHRAVAARASLRATSSA
jgi:hypothetical protein